MRKTLIALMFASTLPALALAMPGDGKHEGPRGKHHAPHMMMKELDLTKDQQRQMRTLMGEQMKNRHEITQRYLAKLPEAEQKAMQDEFKAAAEKRRNDIRALLNPEQQKQFDDMQKKMEAKRAEHAEFQQWKTERDSKKS
ncbi:Spy/CpxP family protein refolding chaperone [Stutzerimonas azotifigens]|uniref:LTXXQ domain protein n=1 Tax=Stutzerimonas azotifigens TaxID=291995 RepID=A0ABR5Z3C4_9GAMM|nr:Spy/CpxP family protein refolding chaperone [Stutzerimonas azotifigens]MBA1274642.1 LTXXQ domain protein [Stutzerimonas azotifigens]